MAIYHFNAKVISRANGSSAVASAAYRSASRLEDDLLGRTHDFSNKTGVVHSEILAPNGAPARWQNRQVLWNEVEAVEKRKDAQLAREVEVAIPREMTREQGVELVQKFVRSEFVARGMVADLNVHWDVGADGQAKPHAHIMLSMREIVRGEDGEVGFGKKVRDWNSRELLGGWRERWAEHVNVRLAELGIDARIDHRTLAAQGIDLEPQNKIGPAGHRREDRGEESERALEHREIAHRNGERIIEDPSLALGAITRQQSTFTEVDLAKFVHRHSDGLAQYERVLSAVRASPEMIALGRDGKGFERYSTREMLAVEQRLERSAESLADREGHRVSSGQIVGAISAAETRGLVLGEDQRDALAHITKGGDLSLVVGYAGAGKSAMLGVAREAWEAEGYTVRGAALSGIAAESLEAGSGIESRTIASLEHGWGQGRDLLTDRDVLVIDEAGMVGSRQMDRVLLAAEAAGAKVVMIGDVEQLQAIDAGAAFRALTERHGAAEITEIRRQQVGWQREATRELATGRTGVALGRYDAAGVLTAHETRAEARYALVEGWDVVRQAHPEVSQVMLAHTRADVAELNQLARARMRDVGQLGEDAEIQTERGARDFAVGDRVMFLRNERSLGVKNGTLGTLEALEGQRLAVRLDGESGRQVAFELKDYAHFDHGYASTIHKSQGVTVDHSHLLATHGMDRHMAYVGMSRHRQTLSLHYGRDDFRDPNQLVRTLGRDRAKDTTLDYRREPAPGDTEAAERARDFGERRGVVLSEIQFRRETSPVAQAPRRGMFDGLKLRMSGRSGAREVASGGPSIEFVRYVAAWADAERMVEQGLPILPHQSMELRNARQALDGASPGVAHDLQAALERYRGFAQQWKTEEGLAAVIRAYEGELAVRVDPVARAERFVETWRALQVQRYAPGHSDEAFRTRRVATEGMATMAEGLKKDPQVSAVLHEKREELGLKPAEPDREISVGRALLRSIGRGFDRDMGR